MEGISSIVRNDLKIPTSTDEFTPEWLSFVLGIPIRPENFQVTGNAHVGTGFLSSVFRISCHTTQHNDDADPDSDCNADRALNLVAKVLQQGQTDFEQSTKQLIIKQGWDINEINVYKHILPDIIAEIPELEPYFCKFYAGFITENPRNSILILEDLQCQNYHSVNFTQKLPKHHTEEAIKVLAKFHCAANAIKQKKRAGSFHEIWPFVAEKADVSAMKRFIIEGYSTLDAFFESRDCDREFRSYFKQLDAKHGDIFDRIFKLVYSSQGTLLHGDLWPNNVMVKGRLDCPCIKIFDWQLLAAGDPVADIAVTIVTCLPAKKLKKDNVVDLLWLYVRTYVECCEKNGLEVTIARDYEELLQRLLTLGMALVFTWFTYGRDPFANNLARYVKIYEFFKDEIDLVPYMLSLV